MISFERFTYLSFAAGIVLGCIASTGALANVTEVTHRKSIIAERVQTKILRLEKLSRFDAKNNDFTPPRKLVCDVMYKSPASIEVDIASITAFRQDADRYIHIDHTFQLDGIEAVRFTASFGGSWSSVHLVRVSPESPMEASTEVTRFRPDDDVNVALDWSGKGSSLKDYFVDARCVGSL